MAKIPRKYNFNTNDPVQAAELNSLFDSIYTEFNGNIDDANIKENANIDASKLLNSSITASKLATGIIQEAHIDYSSVKLLRTGPNITNNGVKIARGNAAFTLVAGVVSITVFYSSGSDDGNPQFAAPPRVTLGIQHAASVNLYSVTLIDVKASEFTATIRSSAGGDVTSGSLDWHAEGNV